MLSAPLASSAAPPRQADAREFAKQVIRYVLSDAADMSSERYLSYFAPRLRAAIVADEKKNLAASETQSRGGHRGSLKDAYGLIDQEPICLCQFTNGVSITIHAITKKTIKAATVFTEVHGQGMKSSRVTWRLAYVGGRWAIADIAGYRAGSSSLLGDLERHNGRAAHVF